MSAAESFAQPRPAQDGERAVPVFTLITWTSCLVVGVAGFVLRYSRPTAPVKIDAPVVAQRIVVDLADVPARSAVAPAPAVSPLQPPPLAAPIALPAPPPVVAVAAPSPHIAFAVPIAAPAPIVESSQASYRNAMTPPAEAAPAPVAAPQPLTFGVGEGKQPAPEYPRLAMRQGQEGTVVVRFVVGRDGRVLDAEAATPSPWNLLNDAALRVIRHRWRFTSGEMRRFEVAIRFQLNKSNS